MESLEITDMKVVPCQNSRFIAPSRVTFKQNGVQRTWDYIKTHDAVAILIFNTTKQSFILVNQFRPAMYMNFNAKANKEDSSQITKESEHVNISAPFENGVSYELCAGIVDEKLSLEETAHKEIAEETGYEVPLDKIERLFSHRGIGTVGSCATLFYAEVTDDMKTSEGGGLHSLGEFIELYHLPLSEAKDFVFKDEFSKPSSVIAALMWFFLNKEGKSS